MLSCEHDRPPVLSLGLIGHRDTLHGRCSCMFNSGTRYQRLIMILATPARGCQVLVDCSIAIRMHQDALHAAVLYPFMSARATQGKLLLSAPQ